MPIKESELILNPDGSVYHLNLKPENISENIIFVGDQDRVERISKHFDTVEFKTQKREFKTHTGIYKGKRLSVISTGIGPDNIDIVMNELDALVNIDLNTRLVKPHLRSLNIVRVGTSGSIQSNVPIDSIVLSTHGLDLTGMMHYYKIEEHSNKEMADAFVAHTYWNPNKARPLIIENSKELENHFGSEKTYKGVTATAGGFYGPQGRVLRLPLYDPDLNDKLESYLFKGIRIANFEMETSVIYGMAKMLGHHALSLNAVIANRATMEFSKDPYKVVDELIEYTLQKFIE
ncbi:MAG: nucleoside phosphorylase [Bacteroidia bacterium]|nr:nucleoside phosphorylase [Bacteroidia bacterium]NNK69402.1 nucleoside phosphorylase [Flavobacteriaceae bacterium]NNL80721.1 nucleoside phosphorylase [Flavobacteriaceae bacterium]